MKVGITGHQHRDNLDWTWVHEELFRQLEPLPPPLVGYSSLASGADQSFADVLIKLGGTLRVIFPFPGYESTFDEGRDVARFRRLRAAAESVEELAPAESEEESYLRTGEKIVECSDVVFAIWDGLPSAGKGGTGDIVAYALQLKRQIVHLNVVTKTSSVLGKS
jgi:hypothetical protein